MSRTIEINQTITVSDLAQQLELPATNLITELVKNGLKLTLNEKIDFDTVSILIDELGLDVVVKQKSATLDEPPSPTRRGAINKTRPPVVAVMGHVDHGKTSLLDKIRGSDRVSTEAGGITQHISATQIKHQDRLITFLDTPGHEAFAAVREHGVLLTDLVLLVVAADDGVKEQTLEAIRFANKSRVKLVVALSKTDKDAANIHLVKQQLAEHELLAEDLGGQIIMMPVSAKTGQGVTELLDMLILVADIEELQADSRGQARGIIIEAYLKKGLGAVAIMLIQEGVLRHGDYLVAGRTWGKVRLLQDTSTQILTEAGASTPVIVSGFKTLPEFGLNFQVVDSDKEAKKLATSYSQSRQLKSSGMSTQELLRIIERRTEINEYKVIVKADVKGSLMAVLNSLRSLDTDEVAMRVVDSGVGSISENDLHTAQIAQATIYCFNLEVPSSIRKQARQLGVDVKNYNVIYELLEDAKETLEQLLAPVVSEIALGHLQVKGVFKTTKTELICGGQVTDGKLNLPASARILRNQQKLAEATVLSLARGPTEVSEVTEGAMCGLRLETNSKINLKKDDVLEFYRIEIKERKL